MVKYCIDCKTVGVFLKISKEIGKAWRKSLACAKRASLTRPTGVWVSPSLFSLVPDLLFNCSRVLEYAKIRTVLQSKYCNTYMKFPSLKKAWIGSACKWKLPIKQYRLDQRRKRVKIVLEGCLAKEIVACVAGAWEIWGARVMHTREKYTHAFSYLAVTEHRRSHFPT